MATATKAEQIRAVADGIAALLTEADEYEVDMARGIHRRPGDGNCWECVGTNSYTVTIRINGGARDTQENILGQTEVLAVH